MKISRFSRAIVGILGFILMMFALQTHALAEDVFLKKGEGVYRALTRAGCHGSWLFQAMIDSVITPNELRRLPIGYPIMIPERCAQHAPKAIASMSALILNFDAGTGRNSAREIERLTKKLESLQIKNQELTQAQRQIAETKAETTSSPEYVALQKELGDARDRIALLEEENARVTILLQDARKSARTDAEWQLTIGMAGGIIAALLAAASYDAYRRRRYVIYAARRSIVRRYQDEPYTFIFWHFDDRGEARYKCPRCNERNILRKNIGQHLSQTAGHRIPIVTDSSREEESDRRETMATAS